MHEVDQDVEVMYTLIKKFSNFFLTIIRFIRVMRVYVKYLLIIYNLKMNFFE